MSEGVLDKSVHIQRETAYEKLCEFEKNYCEDIYKTSTGSIVYEINSTRLAELENVSENELKEFDLLSKENSGLPIEYPSYKKLFEAKYRNRFLKNLPAINFNELQRKLGSGILEEIAKTDKKVNVIVTKIKEADLDNDNVPDRIDIDDSKNYLQTVADLDIVKNSTNKETSEDKKKKEKQKKNNLEL